MKRRAMSWNRCLAVVCDGRKAIALLLAAPLCLSSAVALAADAQLSFSGQIRNASCAVVTPTSVVEAANTQRVEVSEHLSIVVDTSHNACAGLAIPFTTRYESVPVSLAISRRGPAGLLTLTYQ